MLEEPTPRLIFIARTPDAVRTAMLKAVTKLKLVTALGPALFPPVNWHQSISNRWPDTPEFRSAMLRVGDTISASAFVMQLNRVRGNQAGTGGVHWAFRARGKPKGLLALQAQVRCSLSAENIVETTGHSPHVTISYAAPHVLASAAISPIDWLLDELQLVRGGGRPYRYETIGVWPLKKLVEPRSRQMSLL